MSACQLWCRVLNKQYHLAGWKKLQIIKAPLSFRTVAVKGNVTLDNNSSGVAKGCLGAPVAGRLLLGGQIVDEKLILKNSKGSNSFQFLCLAVLDWQPKKLGNVIVEWEN